MKKETQKGVSLLIVLLVGSIMILVAVSVATLALNALKSSNNRALSQQEQNAVQDAFACIKMQVDRDPEAFTSGDTSTRKCGGQSIINFVSDEDAGAGVGNYTFTIPNARGGVSVVIERDISVQHFKGTTTLSAFSGNPEAPRTVSRKQVYYYEGFQGADIIFVIDRSGSIDGGRVMTGHTDSNEFPVELAGNINAGEEWGQLVYSISDSIADLVDRVPQPKIGLLSFGYDAGEEGDTGRYDGGIILPDISLSLKEDLVSANVTNNGTQNNPTDDNLGATKVVPSYTNISLGIAIAGAELIRKEYHPNGSFERAVESADLTSLTDIASSPDRNDAEFPDYIIVITDGEPNGIIRTSNTSVSCINTGDIPFNGLGYIDTASTSQSGQTMLFPTPLGGDVGCLVQDLDYAFCGDDGVSPVVYDTFFSNNLLPHQAMCNATRIARALEAYTDSNQKGVKIAAIGVGVTPENKQWLKDLFVSKDSGGTPLYADVGSYGEVKDAVRTIVERMSLVTTL